MEKSDDYEMTMDQCALECMNAIENKDKSMFKEAFQVLVADILSKVESEEHEGDES